MLLYQRCIVTKLFKKKTENKTKFRAVLYVYLIGSLLCISKRILTSWGIKCQWNLCPVCTYLMRLHCSVLKDACFGSYFQDAFACYGRGGSELITLNHPLQQYSWHRADSVFMYWVVILANMNIQTVVALNRNIVSIWTCIFSSFHLNIK